MVPDHFISGVYLMDVSGNFMVNKQVGPSSDTEASYTFEASAGVRVVTPWALCDQHDLPMGEHARLPEAVHD